MHLFPRPFAAWLAILSLVLNGLTPFVAHAASKAPTMTICSTSAAGQSSAPLKSGTTHFHCAYCCTGTDGSPALSGLAASPAYVETVSVATQSAIQRTHADLQFNNAQPRAPPASQ
jgi:hypothetical protein